MKRKATPPPQPVDEPRTVDALTPDPANRRTHTARNLEMIAASLRSVGAARSIVIDEHNEILAGNGVAAAAAQAGLSKVTVVEAEGDTIIAVRRRGLSADQKRELAIYDNRTAELAAWDIEQLRADVNAGLALEPFFFGEEIAALLGTGGGVESRASLADRFGVPPFSVLDARQGYWQDRKRAWLLLGIESELGRGIENLNGAHPETTSTVNFYAQKRALEAQAGHPLTKDEAAAAMERAGTLKNARSANRTRKANAYPGGSAMPGVRGPRKDYKPGRRKQADGAT